VALFLSLICVWVNIKVDEVQVKLSLERRFKRSITYNFTAEDDHIEDVYVDHAKMYEFADLTWYPSRHTVVYRYDSRVPLNASGDAVYDFIGFQANSILVSESVRAAGIYWSLEYF